jgi:hypothetical protein
MKTSEFRQHLKAAPQLAKEIYMPAQEEEEACCSTGGGCC